MWKCLWNIIKRYWTNPVFWRSFYLYRVRIVSLLGKTLEITTYLILFFPLNKMVMSIISGFQAKTRTSSSLFFLLYSISKIPAKPIGSTSEVDWESASSTIPHQFKDHDLASTVLIASQWVCILLHAFHYKPDHALLNLKTLRYMPILQRINSKVLIKPTNCVWPGSSQCLRCSLLSLSYHSAPATPLLCNFINTQSKLLPCPEMFFPQISPWLTPSLNLYLSWRVPLSEAHFLIG